MNPSKLPGWAKPFVMKNFILDNHFIVEWGGTRSDFIEVQGLSFQREIVTVRDGAQFDSPARKLPGNELVNNVILRRYLKKNDQELYLWWKEQTSRLDARDIVIKLLNAQHEPEFAWFLNGAFPVRVGYSTLNSQQGQPLVEEVEICFDNIRQEAF